LYELFVDLFAWFIRIQFASILSKHFLSMSHTASVDFAVESALAAKAAAAEVAAVEVPAVAPSVNQQGALPDKFKNAGTIICFCPPISIYLV
jgi:hypothetical protein